MHRGIAMATPVNFDMQCLFAREIDASLQLANQVRLRDIKKHVTSLQKQAVCNAANTHDFEDESKDSRFGGRFHEVCKDCGFVNKV